MRRRSFTDQPLLDEQGNAALPAAAAAAKWWDFETIAPTPRDKLSMSLIFVSNQVFHPPGLFLPLSASLSVNSDYCSVLLFSAR